MTRARLLEVAVFVAVLLLLTALWLYPAIATGDARCLLFYCDPRLVLP